MENYNIYSDIAKRSGGDIYLGVVGPVRTGKSTFISKFAKQLIIPNMKDKYAKARALDELPQSADGKTIMTTQPKFIPAKSASIMIDNVAMNVRLIDCVGYLVAGAEGHIEGDKPRKVKTPWSDKALDFEKAAEMGTHKVITQHSTIGVLVTTDGSIADIERANYVAAEERVVKELKAQNKPFVIVLNTLTPEDKDTISLRNSLIEKYNNPVMALDVENLTLSEINLMFENLLNEFPVVSAHVQLPKWIEALPYSDAIIEEVVGEVSKVSSGVKKIGDYKLDSPLFEDSENFEPLSKTNVVLAEGKIYFEIKPKEGLFYKVLSNQCGTEIKDDYHLVSYLKHLVYAKQEFDKIEEALNEAKQTGYGVVHPTMDQMELEEPEIVKQGSKYGVKLKASANSLHIMSVDVKTEVSPIVGSEQQSEELVKSMLAEFNDNKQEIWETKIFGKSLHVLVNEGLNNKIYAMPREAQKKMRKTLGRIVNEGKGGVICILL